MDPGGKFLYVTNPSTNALTVLSIASNGALAVAPGTPITAGTSPVAVAVHPSGQYVYVANQGSSNVSAYSIASNGTPTQITDSPFTVVAAPVFVTWDPNGKWLYVGGQTSREISEYQFTTTNGTLAPSLQSVTTSVAPTSIGLTQ
jgi:6-phosphogluconolactonase (cycloisomerase 2 family)